MSPRLHRSPHLVTRSLASPLIVLSRPASNFLSLPHAALSEPHDIPTLSCIALGASASTRPTESHHTLFTSVCQLSSSPCLTSCSPASLMSHHVVSAPSPHPTLTRPPCRLITPHVSMLGLHLQHACDAAGQQGTHLVEVEPFGSLGLFVVYFSTEMKAKAKAFWQHTGEIISSRLAEAALRELCVCGKSCLSVSVTSQFCGGKRRSRSDDFTCSSAGIEGHDAPRARGDAARQTIANRIAALVGEPASSVALTVCGMAAIYSAYRLVRLLKGSRDPVVVFGFPYLDTLKIMQRYEINPAGCFFFGFGNEEDMVALELLLSRQSIAAVFTEFPSNPLLRCHDLGRLTGLASKHGFLLVVDDTISSFVNVDLMHAAAEVSVDILCSSLTKVFSGRGDVLGGSMVINSSGKFARQLKDLLAHTPNLQMPEIFSLDAEILERNSRDCVSRVYRINETALSLSLWFLGRPEIQQVYFPGTGGDRRYYETVLKPPVPEGPSPGYGCLLSVLLKEHLDAGKVSSFCPHFLRS